MIRSLREDELKLAMRNFFTFSILNLDTNLYYAVWISQITYKIRYGQFS